MRTAALMSVALTLVGGVASAQPVIEGAAPPIVQTFTPADRKLADDAAQRAKAQLESALVDYSGSKFRNVHAAIFDDGGARYAGFCGEINARNRMNGLSGWAYIYFAPDDKGDFAVSIWPPVSATALGVMTKCIQPKSPLHIDSKDYTPSIAPSAGG